ncbi:MAG: hypothetical protein KDJ14_06875 [Xanthomonadales bacterium]|nr:hypothetical protein [Xanthomonadales bacterium]
MDIALTILGSFSAALALAGVRRVPASQAFSLHRMGRFHRVLVPGWHWTVPVLDQITHEVDLIGHRIRIDSDAPSSEAEIFFQIVEPLRVGSRLEEVDGVVRAAAEAGLAMLRRQNTVESASLASDWKQALNTQLRGMGVQVTRCQVT